MASHFGSDITVAERSFPVLLDVERPLELEVGLVVIVDKLGDGRVVAAAEHTRGSGLGFDCRFVRQDVGGVTWAVLTLLLVERLLFCAGSV